jgi:hypothetical protein
MSHRTRVITCPPLFIAQALRLTHAQPATTKWVCLPGGEILWVATAAPCRAACLIQLLGTQPMEPWHKLSPRLSRPTVLLSLRARLGHGASSRNSREVVRARWNADRFASLTNVKVKKHDKEVIDRHSLR